MLTPTDPTHQSEFALTPPPRVEERPATVAGLEEDDKRRRELLGDPAILESVRVVIRRRGVAPDQVDDKLNDVVEDVLRNMSALPLDREEARLYLCGAARFKAIDEANDRKRELEHRAKVTPKEPDTRAPSIDELADAHGFVAALMKRFPKTYQWYLRHKLVGESHGEIGASVNRSPETVRKAIASIQEQLAEMDKKKLGWVVVAAMLAVALGIKTWHQVSDVPWDDQLSHTARPHAPRSDVPRVRKLNFYDDPASLRAAAKQECKLGQWDLCDQHLRWADELDPDGETLELVELEGLAHQKLESTPAKP